METVWVQWILRAIVIPLILIMWVTMNKKIEKSVDSSLCEEKHKNLNKLLDKDDEKLEIIDKKLDSIKQTLVKLDTTIELMQKEKKKNG